MAPTSRTSMLLAAALILLCISPLQSRSIHTQDSKNANVAVADNALPQNNHVRSLSQEENQQQEEEEDQPQEEEQPEEEDPGQDDASQDDATNDALDDFGDAIRSGDDVDAGQEPFDGQDDAAADDMPDDADAADDQEPQDDAAEDPDAQQDELEAANAEVGAIDGQDSAQDRSVTGSLDDTNDPADAAVDPAAADATPAAATEDSRLKSDAATPAPTPTPAPAPSSGPSGLNRTGVIVVVVIGIAAVLAGAASCWVIHRKRHTTGTGGASSGLISQFQSGHSVQWKYGKLNESLADSAPSGTKH